MAGNTILRGWSDTVVQFYRNGATAVVKLPAEAVSAIASAVRGLPPVPSASNGQSGFYHAGRDEISRVHASLSIQDARALLEVLNTHPASTGSHLQETLNTAIRATEDFNKSEYADS